MQQTLNKLETAVLDAMSQNAKDSNALKTQIKNATVLGRNNTGAGFYTEINVPHSVPESTKKTVGNVFAKIFGLSNPMTFVLFCKDGYINTLEGASIEDSTIGVDFSSVKFDLMQTP